MVGSNVYEITSSRTLAEAVFNADFPRLESLALVDHYTTVGALREMVSEGNIRLSNLRKRLSEDEFTTFVNTHQLNGYVQKTASGKPVYEELANDLFFISLTEHSTGGNAQLWHDFGDAERGVVLTLDIQTRAADLRRVRYANGTPTVLQDLNDELKNNLGMHYTPWTISRICAFMLTAGYSGESEVRLLIKRHQGSIDHAVVGSGSSYWPVQLEPGRLSPGMVSDYCRIGLVQIGCRQTRRKQEIEQILAGTQYEAVPVIVC